MNFASLFYRFDRALGDQLVYLTHPAYGRQCWRRGRVRGDSRACAACDAILRSGAEVFRPSTHAQNRADRICAACVDAMRSG